MKRIFNMLYFSVAVLFPCNLKNIEKPDVIVGSSVHLFAAWAANILAKRYGVPFIFEVRDLWPQTLIAMKKINHNSLAARLMRKMEIRLYESAAIIVVLLPGAHKYIENFNIDGNKIIWVPNGVENVANASVQPKNTVFNIIYLGAHGQANNLDLILESVAELRDKKPTDRVKFRFVGEGDQKQRLINKANDLGLDNVFFERGVPREQVHAVLVEADALIFAMNDLPDLYKFGISLNKVHEYMASGKPVIAAINAYNNPVNEAGSGICVMPGNPSALAEAIRTMLDTTADERAEMGNRGRLFVEKYYTYDSLANKYESLLDEVTDCN